MKKRLGRRIICLLLSLMLVSAMLTGCATNEDGGGATNSGAVNTTENIEVNQNDYRGAVKRTMAIKGNILSIIDTFNERNTSIVTENPSSYWESDAYKYLSLNFVNEELLNLTGFFNETETDWATVESATLGNFTDAEGNLLVQNYMLVREDENKYVLNFTQNGIYAWFQNKTASFNNVIDVTYDASHDWAKTVRTRREAYGTSPTVSDGLFEYARLGDNSFAIQTETERLYVVYEDTLYDEANASELLTNPLADKKIVYFCYSRLDGSPLPQYLEVIEDENTGEKILQFGYQVNNAVNVTANGEYICQYNPCDSMFYDIDNVNENWVLEHNGFLSQVLIYSEDTLTVKTLNELSNKMEYTIFHADGTTESGIEEKPTEEDIINQILGAEEEPVEEEVFDTARFEYDNPLADVYIVNCLASERQYFEVENVGVPFLVDDMERTLSELPDEFSDITKDYGIVTGLGLDGTLVSMTKDEVNIIKMTTESMVTTTNNAFVSVYPNDTNIAIAGISIGDKRADVDGLFNVTSTEKAVTYSNVYVNYDDNNKVEYVAILMND